MFTQSADHDHENLSLTQPPPTVPQQQLEQPQPQAQIYQPETISNLARISSAACCHPFEEPSSINFSNKSPQSPLPIQPKLLAPDHSIQCHEGSFISSPSQNSTDSVHYPNLNCLVAPKTNLTSLSSDEQQQCSSQRLLAESSGDVQMPQSSNQIAQQRPNHHHHHQNNHQHHQYNHNQLQSQTLKWQKNDVTTPINRVSTTNVNHHGPLFSNLDSASTLAKPIQEELSNLQAAIKAMSWNSLRHDHLYRIRHNSFSGQDYYRHLCQQRRSFQSQQQQGVEAEFMQDIHATKMMKLDGSLSSSISRQQQQQQQQQQQHHQQQNQQYPHYGVQSRARSIQQIRYQHQPIRLNGKDLKDNYKDDLLTYEGRKEGSNNGQLQLTRQQHLVKTISDLPIFVTIEDFRVASYAIAGEPHLCLPQLLQFLRQHFDTKTMVDKFEESLIHFPSATPKQVEGFIKSSCLPPSAKSCPLIKRSDADKICLSLFEELARRFDVSRTGRTIRPPSDIVSLCSNQGQQVGIQEKHSDTLDKSDNTDRDRESNCRAAPAQEESESSDKSPVVVEQQTTSSHQTNGTENIIACAPKSQSPESIVPVEKNTTVIVSDHGDDKYAFVKKKLKCNNDEFDTTKSDSSSTQDASESQSREGDRNEHINLSPDKISHNFDDDDAKHEAQKRGDLRPEAGSNANATRDTLFESEAQSSILNFARAVTSTLMIRVYHKCFGKCIGLFYPSLLKNKQLKCIQCTSCKVMLTPRRFVGHTHGSKESEVCHWGFNSYNWRSYIRLSKKQPMNNLDEDELLNQFNVLSAANTNEQVDRIPPPAAEPNSQDSAGRSRYSNSGPTNHHMAIISSSMEETQNTIQSKCMDSPAQTKTDRYQASSSGCYTSASSSSDDSNLQPSTSFKMTLAGHNTSKSILGTHKTTDETPSPTLHAPSTSMKNLPALTKPPPLDCNSSSYSLRHTTTYPDLGDGGSMRLARSSSLSGRLPSSACCDAGMMISGPTRSTPRHSTDLYGLTGGMNPYSVPSSSASSVAHSGDLFGQPDQLAGDLRNFLLHNWSSPSTSSQTQAPPQHQTMVSAAQLSMLPLPSLGLPVPPSQACNPLPPMDVTRSSRSINSDLTKHLSLSAESKRELYVCTNLSTYLSRRGLSAGMTGDIVEKVLNLLRESRSTL